MGDKSPYLYNIHNSRTSFIGRFDYFDRFKRLQNGFKLVTIWLQFESEL